MRLQSEVVELFMLRVYVTYTKKVRKFKNKKFIEKLSPIPALQLSYCINRTIAFFGNKYLESLFNNLDFTFIRRYCSCSGHPCCLPCRPAGPSAIRAL